MHGNILLLFVFVTVSAVTVRQGSSGSSGAGVAPQTCGIPANSKFYCPKDKQCKARSLRCTNSGVCPDAKTGKEEYCNGTTDKTGAYDVFLGHATLSRRKRVLPAVEHQFIMYRGFTYEFGGSYGVQILDIIDPKYKYKNGALLNSKGIENVGFSYCTWSEATSFTTQWRREDYRLFTNNCQKFARALQEFLTTGICAQSQSQPMKRQDRNASLHEDIEQILRNCSIVCCYEDDSGSSATSLAPVHLHVLLMICVMFLAVI